MDGEATQQRLGMALARLQPQMLLTASRIAESKARCRSSQEAIARQRAKGLLRRVPRGRRRAAIELAHWSYGAVGGAAFALLPDDVRRTRWAGPAYGLLVWAGFELCLAPVLGLKRAKQQRAVERAALAADHLLYGLVLSEIRARPQERPA